MAVAVATRVEAGQVAEVGRRPVARNGPFGDASIGRGVVGAVDDGGVGNVVVAGHNVGLPDLGGVLGVTVRDRSSGVVSRDESGLHAGWEWATPHVGPSNVVEVDPA